MSSSSCGNNNNEQILGQGPGPVGSVAEEESKNFDTNSGKVNLKKILYCFECSHCKNRFREKKEIIYAGKPYCIMLHTQCAPFYNYDDFYNHDKLYMMYK